MRSDLLHVHASAYYMYYIFGNIPLKSTEGITQGFFFILFRRNVGLLHLHTQDEMHFNIPKKSLSGEILKLSHGLGMEASMVLLLLQ